jgi:hypothetical protein
MSNEMTYKGTATRLQARDARSRGKSRMAIAWLDALVASGATLSSLSYDKNHG